HDVNRGSDAECIGNHAGEQGADGIAQIAPEAIHAETRRAPQRVSVVGYRREQRGIDHGGAGTLQDGPDEPGAVLRHENGEPDADGLHDHSPRDQAAPADPIRPSLGVSLVDGAGAALDSRATWPRVSRTASTDTTRPTTAMPMPR